MKRTRQNKRPQLVLTNDPSMTAWGWVVVDVANNLVVARGCIKTEPSAKKLRIRKGDATVRRISEINNVLIEILTKFNIVHILSELPHGSQNASAAVMMGVVAGIVQTLSDVLKIPVEWYSEADAKKLTLGKNAATKKEMIDKINTLYDMPWFKIKYKDEAIADAMAIYNAAVKTSSIIQFLKITSK